MGIPIQLEEARNLTFELPDELTYEEAGPLAQKLESLHTGMEGSAIEIRFWLGKVVRAIGTERGKGTVSRLSKEYGIAETTIRIARRFADHFEGSVDRMREWARNHVKSGKKLNWQAVIDLTRANRDPRVLGSNALMKRLLASVERSVRDMEAVNELMSQMSEESAEHWGSQVDGVRIKLLDEARELGGFLMTASENPDSLYFTPPRSKSYKDWLHLQPCCIHGTLPVDMHHAVGLRGMGQKASDFGAIPLSHDLHMEYHNIGEQSFEKKYNVSMLELAYNYLHKYLTGQWITLTHLPDTHTLS